jgi:hypothetical protein
VVRIGEESHQKKIQNYRPINKKIRTVFRFWPFNRVKRLQNDGNYGTFGQIPNDFGGCFARFLDSVLRLGRSKCRFLAIENAKSVRFFCRKFGLSSDLLRETDFLTTELEPQETMCISSERFLIDEILALSYLVTRTRTSCGW